MNGSFDVIAEAFSRTAERYDRFAENHPNQDRMRSKVYAHLMRYLEPGARILELNAGTGIDAVFLAQHGFYVHATDISPGMLDRMRGKVERLELKDRVKIQECSFTTLEKVDDGPFDAIFSNLGGLNCIHDLHAVTRYFPALLRPGGFVIWVILPPICLWELALGFTGNFKVAFRRLSRNGTLAHLEGMYFKVYYYSPRQVIAALGPQYTPLAIEGLSVFAPPAESKNLANKHPRIYGLLCWLDNHLATHAPFRGWGDFFIISLQYTPDLPSKTYG